MAGKFIISLDFELHWGGAEVWNLKEKQSYFLNGRKSVLQTLELFQENQIQATWATVGFLFAKNKEQLLSFSPKEKPDYKNKTLSTYQYFDQVGINEKEDPYHFGDSLIKKIIQTKGQELATHTFSHYYCLEAGQTVEQFRADLKSAQNIAKENYGVKLESLVFPRNQYNKAYLEVVREMGIKVVRSNPDVWFWRQSHGKITPILRAADTLLPISKSLSFKNINSKLDKVTEIPASRFFRPYQESEKPIQKLKLNRIKKEMTNAAKNNRCYHLWWHPHNFGNDLKENMAQLKELILHFNTLNLKYSFKSVAMKDFINN